MGTKSNDVTLKILQQKEIDGAALYRKIAQLTKNDSERETLLAISNDEYKHAAIFERYTDCKLVPRRFRIFCYTLAARMLGRCVCDKFFALIARHYIRPAAGADRVIVGINGFSANQAPATLRVQRDRRPLPDRAPRRRGRDRLRDGQS